MDYKTLKQEIRNVFTSLFEQEGFSVQPKPEGIYLHRNRLECRDTIIIDAANYKVEFGMFINMVIHHRQFAIVYALALGQSRAAVEQSWCIKQELLTTHRFLENYRVTGIPDLERWAQACKTYYTICNPIFFQAFNSIDDIHRVLNSVPLGECSYLDHPTLHAEAGLVAAKLADFRAYDGMVNRYRETLTAMDALGSFETVAAFLQDKSTQTLQALQF